MKKYSIKATTRTAAQLVELSIPFVCTYGVKTGLLRLFFLASEEDIKAIEAVTSFTLVEEDEDSSWADFTGWDAIQ